MIERRGGARFSLEAPRPVGILCELSRQQLDAKPTPEQWRRFSSGSRIIFYGPVDDEFGISYVYAAVECLLFDTDTTRGDPCFPPGQTATIEDFIVLHAVEECYHAYQIKIKGCAPANTGKQRDHPLELEANEIKLQAIRDLNINLKKNRCQQAIETIESEAAGADGPEKP